MESLKSIPTKKIIKSLKKDLDNSNLAVRLGAVSLSEKLGKKALPVLKKALRDTDIVVRHKAQRELNRL